MKKKIIVISLLFLIIIFSFYLSARYIGITGLKVKEYKIEANISENFHGLKIVHFSDLHYNTTIDKNNLNKIVDKINFIKPDIVVFTGDLIDKTTNITTEIKNDLIESLSKINSILGKYSITGEHDNESTENILTSSNFVLLNNDYDLIYQDNLEPIMLAGISSNIVNNNIVEKMNKTNEYLSNNNIKYKILLMHEPDYIDNISNFDLVLAGHSHNNQVNIPIINDFFKIDGAKKYYNEYYEVNNTKLFVSSGLGTSRYKLRLFNKPSINFYRIIKES